MKKLILSSLIASTLLLFGCNKESSTDSSIDNTRSENTGETQSLTDKDSGTNKESDTSIDSQSEQNSEQRSEFETDSNTVPASTRDKQIDINWKKVDSGVKPINPDDFNYPFELDSSPVTSQVAYSKITPKQAQYSLTVGMASNEALDKLLDQLGDSYLSHKFLEKEAKLVILTTPNVTPSSHKYVIENDFAKGLTLPIEIKTGSESDISKANNQSAH